MQEELDNRRGVGDRAAPPSFDPRVEFPILDQRIHGRPLIWLDNAATTQKPRVVIDRLSHFYCSENANVHRGGHALGARATAAYEQARETVARFLHAPHASNIVFVRGTTEAINLVAATWARAHLGPDDDIVVTALEHHSNIVPWQMLAAERELRLRVAPIDATGQVDLAALDRLLAGRVKLLALTHMSNALGTVTPVKEIVRRAHAAGARVLVDGAQAVAHVAVDVQDLDADFYAFSGHKVFGPTGIGALFAKADHLEAMPPWQGGGSMVAELQIEASRYQPAPYRFEAGTPNIAGAVALGAALDFVSALGTDRIEAHDRDLTRYAVEALGRIHGLRHVGTAPDKLGVISFVVDGVPSNDIGAALDADGIAVRVGHHCALPALQSLGVDTIVRPSLAVYNTREDVDALVASLARFLEQRATGRGERS